MAQPKTYLFSAPKDVATEFGVTMSSTALLAGLRRIDAAFSIPPPTGIVYVHSQNVDGISGLWHGAPYAGGKFISAIHLGIVPEYTMIEAATGRVFKFGWRRIFEKIISTRFASRFALEHTFNVNLTYDGASGLCRDCQRRGYKVQATVKNEYCDDCFQDRLSAASMKEAKRERKWLAQHPTPPSRGRVSLHLGS